jgi:hypothetical protein
MQRVSYRTWIVGLLVATCAVALRLNSGLSLDLWEDEIIAATHAMQPLWLLPVEVARHDVHPFLYFLQLHLWSLAGTSDVWFKLNSVFWNIVAIGSIGLVGKRLYDQGTGCIAATLFALSPPSVWMAQEVRPYSWLYVLFIWTFYATELACRAGFRGRWTSARVLAFCVAIIYSHAIGFLVVFFFGVYAFVRLSEEAAGFRAYRNWLFAFGLAALTAVPALATDLMRNANLGAPDTLSDIALWFPRMVLPRGDQPLAIALAAGIYGVTVLSGVIARPTRTVTAVFLVLPLALCAVTNAAGTVLFKLNIFSTIVTPFLVMVIARLSRRIWPRPGRIVVCLSALLFIAGSVDYLNNRVPTTGFRAAAQMIRVDQQSGDVVYVPQQSMFWGMAWYLIGPDWGSALAVSGATDAPWRRVYQRLGPRLIALLHLEPTTQILVAPHGLVLLVGPTSQDQAAKAHRIWLVTYDRADLPAGFPPASLGALTRGTSTPIQQLTVTLYQ